MAVTYATIPMGADHTAGSVVAEKLEEFGGTIDQLDIPKSKIGLVCMQGRSVKADKVPAEMVQQARKTAPQSIVG